EGPVDRGVVHRVVVAGLLGGVHHLRFQDARQHGALGLDQVSGGPGTRLRVPPEDYSSQGADAPRSPLSNHFTGTRSATRLRGVGPPWRASRSCRKWASSSDRTPQSLTPLQSHARITSDV